MADQSTTVSPATAPPPIDLDPIFAAGIDGMDAALPMEVRPAFAQLEKVSGEKVKEAKAGAILLPFLAREFPQMPVDLIQRNFGAVKSAYAKREELGSGQPMTNEALFGKIAERKAKQKEIEETGMVHGAFSRKGEPWTAQTFARDVMKSLVELPEMGPQKNLPWLGIYNPALIAASYNSFAKPILEGVESPLGIATFGAGPMLSAGARAYPAARAAVAGISGIFAGAFAYASVSAAPSRLKVILDKDASPQEKMEAMGMEIRDVGLSLLGGLGAVEAVNPNILAKLEGKTPAQATDVLHEAALESEKPAERVVLMNAAEELNKVSNRPKSISQTTAETKTEEALLPATHPPAEPPVESSGMSATRIIGLRNADVEAEAERMGVEAPTSGEKLSQVLAAQKAREIVEQNPLAGTELVDKLIKKPRPLNGVEDALLLHELTRRSIVAESADAESIAAQKSGDVVVAAEAKSRAAKAQDDYAEAQQADRSAGTVNAQGLAHRRMRMKQDYSLANLKQRLAAATEGGKLSDEQEDFVRDINKKFKETADALDKTRKEGKDTEKPEADHQRVVQDFEQKVAEGYLDQREWWAKFFSGAVNWRRAFVLSSPKILVKLPMATAFRVIVTPAEEVVGLGLGKLPFIRDIAKGAPVQGGLNIQAMAKAITQGWMHAGDDFLQTFKTGQSNLDVLYGKGRDTAIGEASVLNNSWTRYISQMHGALKSVLKRMAYTMAFEKQVARGLKNGENPTNPLVQMAYGNRAYRYAQEQLFLQDNAANDMYNAALKKGERGESMAGKALATGGRLAVPVAKVPTNIIGEATEYAFGLLTGSAKTARAFRTGIEKLTPEQRDVIMRNFKKGGVGFIGTSMLMGYFTGKHSPIEFGGQYVPGKKLAPNEVKPNEIRVFDQDVPAFMLDHPLFQALQAGQSTYDAANMRIRKSDTEPQGIISGAWAAGLGLVDETPFGREMVEAGKIVGGSPSESKYAQGELAKSLVVPSAVDFVAKQMDKNTQGNIIKRKPDTILEHIETSIPGLRQNVKRNPNFSLRND